ncbi:hypothetical protein BKI52_35680 [marine bacterium AO1-C]|nr:hypothetical protein BKI52_35680 [marine bacterium AO1-C]
MGKHCQLLTQNHFVQNFLWFWSLVLALHLLPLPTAAQRPAQKDSLLKVLKTLPEDTSKVNLLNRLSFICRINDSQNAFKLGKQSLLLSRKIAYKKGVAAANYNLGLISRISGKYDDAITYQETSREQWVNLKDYTRVAHTDREMGITYRQKGEFPEALKKFFNALKMYERLEEKHGQGLLSASIGILYYRQKEYGKSLEYSLKALKMHEELKDWKRAAIDYNNIGNVYADLKKYEKALFYYREYKKIKEKLNDERGIANALTNIGFVFGKQEKYKLAIQYQKQALDIYTKINLKRYQAYPLQYLAEAYAALKDFDKASYYNEKALEIAEQIGAKHRAMEISASLSTMYQESGNYESALKYYQKYKRFADSIFNEKKSEQITDIQTKYGTEKKEQENKILKLEVKQRNNLIAGTTIGGGLLLILAFVLYRSNRRKQKTNRVLVAQKQEIEIQTEEIMAQRDMLEQQHKDIRDSINYARKIQTAILPLKEEISAALPEHFLFYQPRDIVSGDFYWFAKIEQENPKYVIAISDCTGHGVPGAFMSMIGNDLLNDIVKARQIIEPNVILDLLHVGVRKALHQETGENSDGMDISLCVIDPQQKTVSYAGANSPLVYVKDGELTRVAPNKTSIGGSKTKFDKGFQAHTITYQDAPVMCYLYSDGYRDQFGGEKGKKFMRPRFLELVFYISQLSMQEQRRQIEDTITEWMKQGGYDQMDDMLVMGFRLS